MDIPTPENPEAVLNKPIKKKVKLDSLQGNTGDNRHYEGHGFNNDFTESGIKADTLESTELFPRFVDGIKVIKMGEISPNPMFHTLVQIYPVGYKAEIESVKTSSKNKSGDKLTLLCEILEKHEEPEFVISVKSLGKVFRGSTEAIVWNKCNSEIDRNSELSFFNLQIELMIEGLDGVEQYCPNYKTHYDRGYLSTYHTQTQAEAAKRAFIAKTNREQRTQLREQSRVLSPEELRQMVEQKKKQEEFDREAKRIRLIEEKEHKDRQREEQKLQREALRIQKEEEKLHREEAKLIKEAQKEQQKEAQKDVVKQEKIKKDNKINIQIRREVTSEIRKARNDASSSIIHRFDEEEESYLNEILEKTTTIYSDSNSSTNKNKMDDNEVCLNTLDDLNDLISRHKTCAEEFGLSALLWEDILQISTCFHTLRGHLQLQTFLISFIKTETTTSTSTESSLVAHETTNGIENGVSDIDIDIDIDTGTGTDTDSINIKPKEGKIIKDQKDNEDEVEEEEEEWVDPQRDSTRTKTMSMMTTEESQERRTRLMEAEALLDRIQLSAVKAIFGELRTVLGLDEKDVDSGRMSGSGSGSVNLPLNQMTWPDIARMCFLLKVEQEIEKTDDEISHVIRGSRQAQFRSAKNIIRNIRYRMATRARIASSNTTSNSSTSNSSSTSSKLKSKFYSSRNQYILPGKFLGDDEDGFTMSSVSDSSSASAIIPKELHKPLFLEEGPYNFSSEDNIIQELQRICTTSTTNDNNTTDNNYFSDLEKRCCKVLIRLLNLQAAKIFIWEVDKENYPDYYETIKIPITLSQIASKLLAGEYRSIDTKDENINIKHENSTEKHFVPSTVAAFYRDVRQCLFNGLVYYTETTSVIAQSQKVFQALFRHVQRWILCTFTDTDQGPGSLPPLDVCDEFHCLLSGVAILQGVSGASIRCGRCSGTFDVMITQTFEDWYCPFCLREDSTCTSSTTTTTNDTLMQTTDHFSSDRGGYYHFDEWGPSSQSPWLLNAAHNLRVATSFMTNSQLQPLLNAIHILSKPYLSSISDNEHDITTTTASTSVVRTWSVEERIVVLRGLCELLKTHSSSQDYLARVSQECQKLTSTASLNSFREADFMDRVRRIAGDEGVALCRSMMGGGSGSGSGAGGTDGDENDMIMRVIEGRCTVCKKSTYNEDCIGISVILCDGCNSEAHLPCLKLAKVPTEEWFCELCTERNSNRIDASGGVSFGDLRPYRRMDEETALAERLREIKAAGQSNIDQDICEYCGLGKFDLCSPLVYGQTRQEFIAHLALSKPAIVDDFYEGKKGTVVHFTIERRLYTPPKARMPYFPLVRDERNKRVFGCQSISTGIGLAMGIGMGCGSVSTASPVVHELCALRMSQARTDRSRHLLRRRRRLMAERVVQLFGVENQPLGLDSRGRMYWRFPTCTDLFICTPISSAEGDPDRYQWNQLQQQQLQLQQQSNGNEEGMDVVKDEDKDTDIINNDAMEMDKKKQQQQQLNVWIRVSDNSTIRRIAELLGANTNELALKQALLSTFCSSIVSNSNSNENKEESHPAATGSTVSSSNVKEISLGAEGFNSSEKIDQNNIEMNDKDIDNETSTTLAVKPSTSSTDEESRVPIALKLIENKGSDVPRICIIDKDTVFEEEDDDDDEAEEGEEDNTKSFKEYFSFSRNKYYAVALIDKYERKVRVAKDDVTITLQIHREGQTIAYTPLNEPWSDGLFYFCTVNFKRSGSYNISFIVEGSSPGISVKPLVFPITVQAKKLLCGTIGALDRLRASSYVTDNDRQILVKRRELMQVIQNESVNEIMALRQVLVSIYLALPAGSLQYSASSSSTNNNTGTNSNDTIDKNDIYGTAVAECQGWNDVLDLVWREEVMNAISPQILMECTLLLEYYINKTWLSSSEQRLISTLPNAHFAVRCVTPSSVALRLFSLDRAILYEKIQGTGRTSRGCAATETKINVAKENAVSSTAASRRSAQTSASTSSSSRGRGRGSSGSATASSSAIQEQDESGDRRRSSRVKRTVLSTPVNDDSDDDEEDEEEEEEEEEEDGYRGRLRVRKPAPPVVSSTHPQEWSCASCATMNAARARSCAECGDSKPPASGYSATGGGASSSGSSSGVKRGRGRPSRSSQRQVQPRYADDIEEEEDEDEDEEDEEEQEEEEEDDARGPVLRIRKSVSYKEKAEDDIDNESSGRRGTRSSGRGETGTGTGTRSGRSNKRRRSGDDESEEDEDDVENNEEDNDEDRMDEDNEDGNGEEEEEQEAEEEEQDENLQELIDQMLESDEVSPAAALKLKVLKGLSCG
eukprot:gene4666-9256_t